MAPRTVCPAFPRHFSYDLTFFGSWRRKGIEVGDKQYAAPDAYTVLGFNFASMYNFGYKFRAGVSLDGVYDGSANVAIADQIVEMGSSADLTVEKPGVDQAAGARRLGRAEFVMPYFNIGVGLGTNFLHKGRRPEGLLPDAHPEGGRDAQFLRPHRLQSPRFPHAQLPDAGRRIPVQQQIPAAPLNNSQFTIHNSQLFSLLT